MVKINKKVIIFFLGIVLVSVGIVMAAWWLKNYLQQYQPPRPTISEEPVTRETDKPPVTNAGQSLDNYFLPHGSLPPVVLPSR